MRPSLRQEQLDRTRQRIIEATVEHLAEQGDKDLSLPGLAERAGVSVPTIYRHFPSIEKLMDAFADHMRQEHGFRSYDEFTADEVPEMARRIYQYFDNHEEMTNAMLLSAVGREWNAHARKERVRGLRRVLEPMLADHDETTATRAFAVIQLLMSAVPWQHMRENCALGPGETGEAAAWAIEILLSALRDHPTKSRRSKR